MNQTMRFIACLVLVSVLGASSSGLGYRAASSQETPAGANSGNSPISSLDLLPTAFLGEMGGVRTEIEEHLTLENVRTRSTTFNTIELMLNEWIDGAYGDYLVLNETQAEQSSTDAGIGRITVLVNQFGSAESAWSLAEALDEEWRAIGVRRDSLPEYGDVSVGYEWVDGSVTETAIIVQVDRWTMLFTGSFFRQASQGAAELSDAEIEGLKVLFLAPIVEHVVTRATEAVGTASSSTDSGQNEFAREPVKPVAHYDYPGYQHSDGPVQFAEHPPVGGVHAPVWYTCQYYDEVIKSEIAVHSLEHGAVWITFDPDLAVEQKALIRSITEEQGYILASPMMDLPAPVVASSWNNQILLDGADDPDLRRFISIYKQGQDTPEPGASCTGITDPEGA